VAKPKALTAKTLWAQRSMNLRQLLLATSRMVNTRMTALLLKRGHKKFKPTHLSLYSHIDFEGTRLNVLATRANMTKQAMWQLANELQTLGYVKRKIDASDRRNRIIALTDAGNELMLETMNALLEIEAELRGSVGPSAYAGMRDTLHSLAHAKRATRKKTR
jgi:DNA-binding MarR family transcriptional regulator